MFARIQTKLVARFLAALTALGAAGILFTPAESIALPSKEVKFIYYTDSTYSEWAGWEVFYCNGGWDWDGDQTPYYLRVERECQTTQRWCYQCDDFTQTCGQVPC